jgi:hypothetical protein
MFTSGPVYEMFYLSIRQEFSIIHFLLEQVRSVTFIVCTDQTVGVVHTGAVNREPAETRNKIRYKPMCSITANRAISSGLHNRFTYMAFQLLT